MIFGDDIRKRRGEFPPFIRMFSWDLGNFERTLEISYRRRIFVSYKNLIDKLYRENILSRPEFKELIDNHTEEDAQYLFERAREVRERVYKKAVYTRGLIEFTNYCRNDCLYCGIRRSNGNASRYRLDKEQILQCCDEGYELGFRTFVLQGGEDMYYKTEDISSIVREIKSKYPDCAVTLSVGERSYEDYLEWYNSGADRYLLRHETASDEHYKKLHPQELSLANRKKCLFDLKEIGYQVGAGFMVGSPYQTTECLVEDLYFLNELKPHMIGIGPFIPQQDTPFADKESGTLEKTLFMLGILRLMFPGVLLPATTALGTIAPNGRELGLKAGANVVMPNLSPVAVRDKYKLYDNKICTGEESAQCKGCLQKRIESVGYEMVVDRGDCKDYGIK